MVLAAAVDVEAGTVAVAAGIGALIATVRWLTASSRNVAADRLTEIKDLREQLKRLRDKLEDAEENAKQAEVQCRDRIHKIELATKDREGELGRQVASLQANLDGRPDTESLASAIREQTKAMSQIETAVEANTEAVTMLVRRNRSRRASDPGGHDPPSG